MAIITQVTELLQGLLEESMDVLARETGCVKRERKFSGSTLLSTLVLTILRNPKAKPRDYQTTAAQLGVDVTENAISQRFTPELVKFLEAALKPVLSHVLATDPPPIELLGRFSEVPIGDSTTITLPDEYAEQFPGCGGSHGSGKAALKIQVLWDLRSGRLQILLEPGRASDNKSPITELSLSKGSLSIFDLGYFSLDRFERVEQAGGLLAVAAAARHDRLRCGRKACRVAKVSRQKREVWGRQRVRATRRKTAAVPAVGHPCLAGNRRAAAAENP